jgi:hypothetical protein
VPGHALALAQEAGAEHVVGATGRHGGEHLRELGRVVLAVSVEVDRGVVATVAGVPEACPERRAEPATGRVADHAGTVAAGDGRGRVIGAVVDDEHVDIHPARPGRHRREHCSDARLLVPGDDDREAPAPVGGRRDHTRVALGQQRPSASRRRSLDPQQLRDRPRQLEHGAPLAGLPAGHGTLAPDHERHGALPPVHVPVAADSAALPVVRHQDHGRALQLSALLEEGEEVTHVAVGLLELAQVLRVAHAANVAELISGE